MTLIEVSNLMEWIDNNRIDQYVRIGPLQDAVLDLLVVEISPESLSEPVLN